MTNKKAKNKRGDKRNVRNFILPPVSNYLSRKEWEKACWNKILKSKKILKLMISSHECRNLVLRAAVASRLYSGKSYRQIANELWLSSQTISSIKKALKRNGYKSYRERGKTERKRKVYSPSLPKPKKEPSSGQMRRAYGKLYRL